jgi:hypothetical protein
LRKRASWNTAAGLAVAALLIPAAEGHVVTWDKNGSGFLSCGETMSDDGPEKAGAAERAAARETCPAGSSAGETA